MGWLYAACQGCRAAIAVWIERSDLVPNPLLCERCKQEAAEEGPAA